MNIFNLDGIYIDLNVAVIAENTIWQGHTESVFELKRILLTDKLFQLLLLLRNLIHIDRIKYEIA